MLSNWLNELCNNYPPFKPSNACQPWYEGGLDILGMATTTLKDNEICIVGPAAHSKFECIVSLIQLRLGKYPTYT